ncbi:MAG: hypothetical protein ACK4WH_07860 [Phycisphaerales bacterium]
MNRRLRRSHALVWLMIAPAVVAVLLSSWVVRARVEARLNESISPGEVGR